MTDTLAELKAAGQAPEWLTPEGFQTLMGGYLVNGETPRDMYERLSDTAATILGQPELAPRFLDVFWKGWLCPATPVASNFGAGRALPISCVTGDMLINTYSGGTYAKDVKIGDLLLTHENRWRPVTNVMRRQSDDIYQLKVGLRTSSIKVTGNHPVLTNLGWVRVDALDPQKHLIAVNGGAEYPEHSYVLDMTKHCPYTYKIEAGKICKTSEAQSKKSKAVYAETIVQYYSQVTHLLDVDEELGWALGLWFAEGGVSGGYVHGEKRPSGLTLTMGAHESDIISKWVEIITRRFGINGSIRHAKVVRQNDKTNSGKVYSSVIGKCTEWLQANVNSKLLGTFFYREFGKNCKVKSLPSWILELPKPVLSAFLKGFTLGDGSEFNGMNKITLSNPYLLCGLYNIALKLGLPVSLNLHSKPGRLASTKYTYTLTLMAGYENSVRARSIKAGIQFGSLIYAPIRKITKLGITEEVFDFTVEEDHSFSVCGVVVHNCYSLSVPDSVDGIFKSVHELAMLSKNGGGVGVCLTPVRARNAQISGGYVCEGINPWAKVFDSTTVAVSQGSVRRGATAFWLDIEHGDAEEYLGIRRPVGDAHRQCLNVHHAVTITDSFMRRVELGETEARKLWTELLKTRYETGEPYIMFIDTVNKANPPTYVDRGLKVETSNICSEVVLHTDKDHTFVCCLSSLNLSKYDEWKDTDVVKLGVYFLDAVMSEFIGKAEHLPGLERAVRSAKAGRAIGLGALGWHTYLQERMIPFESFKAMQLNAKIFKQIREQAEEATKELAVLYGEPEWCVGYGRRNTHLLALAPTVSNSTISGNVSPSIEPLTANAFTKKGAKGVFIQRNPTLKRVLAKYGKDTDEVWRTIVVAEGSVQHLEFLTDEEKDVFRTAREVNQRAIIQQAAQRQKFIDQAQSINLFFPVDVSPSFFHKIHMEAWKAGLKTLYYCRTGSVLKGDQATRFYADDCQSCSG